MNPTLESDLKDALTDQDMDGLHVEDLHAARIVVGLMTGVFVIGLLMHSFIFWVVW